MIIIRFLSSFESLSLLSTQPLQKDPLILLRIMVITIIMVIIVVIIMVVIKNE